MSKPTPSPPTQIDLARSALADLVATTQPLQQFIYTAFRNAADTESGSQWVTTWEAWAHNRRCLASQPAPAAEKTRYRTEFGAVFDGQGKKNANVQAVTWLFLDFDRDTSAETLQRAGDVLKQLNLAFLLCESSSSRCPGKGYRWHAYVQLLPITMPSPATPQLDWDETVRQTALWWSQVHSCVRSVLAQLWGGNPTATDTSVDHWAQPTFAPHRPVGTDESMDRTVVWSDGRPLDVVAALEALQPIYRFEPIKRPSPAFANLLPSEGGKGGRGVNEGASSPTATTSPVALSRPQIDDVGAEGGNATPNESTGSLLYKALDHFNLIGPRHDRDSFQTLCPWRHLHSSAVANGTQDTHSSSTLCYVSGHHAKEDGGFDCKHEGCREDGRPRSAADVLSWARRLGAPIPDRPEWSQTPLPIPAPPVGSEVAESICTEFEKAIEQREEIYNPPSEFIESEEIKQPASIEITNDIMQMAQASLEVLQQHPRVFVKGGHLVELVLEKSASHLSKDAPKPRIRPLTFPYLLAVLSQAQLVEWYKLSSRRGVELRLPEKPDRDAVKAVLAGSLFPGIRQLEDVVSTPVFRRDGTLLQQSGYDAATGLYYHPDTVYPHVTDEPTRQELIAAKATILEPLRDYRHVFRRGQEALCAGVWLSAVFTPFLRQLINGPRPMIIVSANRAGGGKTKLVTVAALISDGRPAAMSGKMLGDDAELERILGMHIESGTQTLCFDNVPSGTPLASPALEAFITAPEYITRKIGTSTRIKAAPFGLALWGTGNGVETGGDMQRRVLRIEIEDTSQDPSKRVVEQAELEDFVRRERPRLVHAALTLLSGFFAARRRRHSVKLTAGALSSFSAWSEFARSAVVWCGLPDPALARGAASDDTKAAGFKSLCQHIIKLCPDGNLVGNLTAELVRARAAKDSERVQQLRDFDGHLVDEGIELTGRRGDSVKLGRHLAKYRNDVVTLDGKQWQLRYEKTTSGNMVRVVEKGSEVAK